ncbi:class I SAM-dependent methyltransferase [Asticcacaulis sp. YBE204]|uniref:class I SAM-dependent methyltransferase n=1 Tax=Asticcacaulis sp. YBE204 TaxID=1282363 RepID=UPI0003C409A9|nr:class I SAM-dependent methyltransferase [Asticcacaulis sp. YBE204]ESQ80789.1 hypothetical protein AEYBE204_00270 [Asticcacaulis sp. YBE204]
MSPARSTDDHWERWGREDPYYGVYAHDSMRRERLTADALDHFFASGQTHIEGVFAYVRRYIDPAFSPRRGLDFGCGTGRLVIPMAGLMDEVAGMDISSSMLDEARRNIDARDLHNVHLLKSDDALSQLSGSYDFIHSYIVFQHIPPERGQVLFQRLVKHLAPGGVGALHILFGKTFHAANFGQTPSSFHDRILAVKRGVHRLLMRLMGRKAATEPEMQMNIYDLNTLFFMLKTAGVGEIHTTFEDHGGEWSAFLFFRKP